MAETRGNHEIHEMVTFQRVIKLVCAEPFRPFQVNLTGGRTFEICDPEMVNVGLTRMTIYTYLSDDPEEAKEQEVQVSLMLIDSIELLEPASPSKQGAG